MKRAPWLGIAFSVAVSAAVGAAPFRRGDTNIDGRVDLSDGVNTLGFLFLGSNTPACLDAADANDSGALDLADAVFTLGYLFTGGAAIPAPGPTECGPDPTGDALGCDSYAPSDAARRCADGPVPFSVSLPPHTMAIHGISFEPAVADLDLTVYDAQGMCLGGRVRESCAWSDRTNETGEEYLSVLNAGDEGEIAYSWRVEAPPGSPVNFTPVTDLVPYFDGPTCTDVFPADECEGRPGGVLRLLQFPFPDPDDSWVGDGYRFDSLSNYRWARRELVMLVRHAIHETQLKFPGTRPVGLGDICQRDGVTPGYDIDQPRHPESTHDQGANIDVAYYTTLSQDGTLDYNPLRIICDANGGSHVGSYCNASASQTHVVDLPRQVYFMAKLYESPRLRVIGVDRVIAPLLLAEAERQMSLGWITNGMLQAFGIKMGSGEGWPFHHHHIHVSLEWWQ